MKLQTLKYIAQAFNVASDDATRYALQHVSVKQSKQSNKVEIAATNGHALSLILSDDAELFNALKDKTIMVSQEQLPLIKAIIKKYPKAEEAPFSVADNGQIYIDSFLKLSTDKELNISYPNYEAFIPQSTGYDFEIGFNPELLMDIYKAMNTEKRSNGIKIKWKDKLSPIIVCHDNQESLLMPMRL